MSNSIVAFPLSGSFSGATLPIKAIDNGDGTYLLGVSATVTATAESTAEATVAAPSYSEGQDAPLSQNLTGDLRTIAKQSGTWNIGTVTTVSAITVLNAIKGAANLVTAQATSTGTAATLVVARPTRRSVLIRNLDTANSIWVGPATVTTGNGFQIKPGESCPFTWVGLIQVIDNGSHAAIGIADEYD